jgi:hypothetical protein
MPDLQSFLQVRALQNKREITKMRKNFFIGSKLFMGSLLAGCFLAPQVFAGPPDPVVAIVEQPQAQSVTISGKVKMISAATVTVVDDSKAEHNIGLDSNTKIMKAGKEATVADIKADALVSVVANKSETGALTAVTINIA